MASALVVSGCAASRFDDNRISTRTTYQPQQLQPVGRSQVHSQALSPLSGQPGPTLGDTGYGSGQYITNADGTVTMLPQQDGSLASVPTPGSTGRDLSAPLTPSKLLGTWTMLAGVSQCRLNLTQTAKPGTSRYRASVPGCGVPIVATISSWQLTGSQIQFYDDSGALIGSLLHSGNRFLGTMSGGTVVSIIG